MAKRRVIVALSGGSGIPYAIDLLQALRLLRDDSSPIETHLIVTSGAKQVIPTEVDVGLREIEALADVTHKDQDLGASIASGSVPVHAMVIVPCSAGTLAKVALGLTDNLVSRAAHVTLKERRPLVLVVREAPYPRPMLQNMLRAFDAGAVLMPASPGFYLRPESVAALVRGVTSRVLDLIGIANQHAPRWKDG
jgi:flavin prenyltransferase